MQNGQWQVYLSGEIHTDWRQRIAEGAAEMNLPTEFTSAVTIHCGAPRFPNTMSPPSIIVTPATM